MQSNTISIIASLVAGGVIAFIGHIFAQRREGKSREHAEEVAQRARKRDFLSFMDVWRARIERTNPRQLGGDFGERVATFRGEQAKIRDDFVGLETRKRFDELVVSLASLHAGEVEEASPDGSTDVGKDKLLLRFDAIVGFAREN